MTMTFPKRGGFAKDTRTGLTVKIHEESESPEGSTWMVRVVHKSDGYWVSSANLRPAKNPYDWNRTQWMMLLVVLAVSAFAGYGAASEISNLGGDLLFTVSAGALIGSGAFDLLTRITGLAKR
jgi:hypothetical protein